MPPVLAASSVTVRVGTKTLIDGISLSLEAGEIAALVGPNGAGKSTLMRVLSGDLLPGAGTVELKGRQLRSYGPRTLARHRAMLSQSVSVAFSFTVAEIVRMGAGDRRGRAIDDLVDTALDQVDLAGFHERVITTLSGGEQQRAHFARILVQLACGEAAHGPGVLLLDEPTASLDLRHQLDVIETAKSCAARGVTVVAILHDLNLAALLAQAHRRAQRRPRRRRRPAGRNDHGRNARSCVRRRGGSRPRSARHDAVHPAACGAEGRAGRKLEIAGVSNR